jgi:hypothetical protein
VKGICINNKTRGHGINWSSPVKPDVVWPSFLRMIHTDEKPDFPAAGIVLPLLVAEHTGFWVSFSTGSVSSQGFEVSLTGEVLSGNGKSTHCMLLECGKGMGVLLLLPRHGWMHIWYLELELRLCCNVGYGKKDYSRH